MSKRVLILVEGQTEERFVKDVLGPAFYESRVMTESRKQPEFAAVCSSVPTPEEINERPQFAPSQRIKALFPAYKKTLHGPTTAARIGLDRIRAECPHFGAWLDRLEAFAAQ